MVLGESKNRLTATSLNDRGAASLFATAAASGPGQHIVTGNTNDTITAGDGNDTIHAGGGNDLITPNDGDDVVYCGEGNDTVDTWLGLDGNDVIHGEGGNDVLTAANPIKAVYGGSGNDRIDTGSFSTGGVIDGGSGQDTVNAYERSLVDVELVGVERLSIRDHAILSVTQIGGVERIGFVHDTYSIGFITLADGGRADLASKTSQAINISASDFGNVILCGGADDILHGGRGNDTLHAGAGADELFISFGADSLFGGAGNDLIQFDYSGDAPLRGTVDGGGGFDSVQMLGGTLARYEFVGVEELIIVTYDAFVSATALEPFAHIRSASGNGFGISLIDEVPLDLSGRAEESARVLASNRGNHIISGDHDDILVGRQGRDTLEGGDGSDYLETGGGADILRAGEGNDRLVVKTTGGSGVIEGGAGSDTIEAWQGIADFDLVGVEVLDIGITRVEVTAKQAQGVGRIISSYAGGSPSLELRDGGRLDLSKKSPNGISVVASPEGNAIITGGALDYLYGSDGNDTLDAGGGNDQLWLSLGTNVVRAGAGNDFIVARSDSRSGDVGGGRIDGGAGSDIIVAENADLTPYTLIGVEAVITPFSSTGVRLSSQQIASLSTLQIEPPYSGLIKILIDDAGAVSFQGKCPKGVEATASRAGNVITGSALGDVLRGNVGQDRLDGSDGNDVLDGLGGNDRLMGGRGNDMLSGHTGRDWLEGGAGKDKLGGGGGLDTFVFSQVGESATGISEDVIRDFVSGSDRIDVRAIDANLGLRGNQSFTLDDGDARLEAGEIRQVVQGGNMRLEFNVNASSAAEMAIVLTGVTRPLAAADFLL